MLKLHRAGDLVNEFRDLLNISALGRTHGTVSPKSPCPAGFCGPDPNQKHVWKHSLWRRPKGRVGWQGENGAPTKLRRPIQETQRDNLRSTTCRRGPRSKHLGPHGLTRTHHFGRPGIAKGAKKTKLVRAPPMHFGNDGPILVESTFLNANQQHGVNQREST